MDQEKTEIRQILPVQQILLRCILPVACSAAIGFLVPHWGKFGYYPYVLQFVMDATVASIFFYSLTYLRRRDAYAVLLILFFLTLLITKSTRLMYVLRDLLDTGGIATAVILYYRQLRSNSGLKSQYFGLVFSGILGVCMIVAWSTQLFFVEFIFSKHQPIDLINFISMAAFYGFLVGLGVGVGFVINRRVLDRVGGAETAT